MEEAEVPFDDDDKAVINKIHEEIRKISQLETQQDNNTSGRGIIARGRLQSYLISDDVFCQSLLSRKLDDCSVDRKQPITALRQHLEIELDCLKNDLMTTANQMQEEGDELERLKTNITNIEAMMTSNEISSEEKVLKNMSVVEVNIKRRFKKEKADMKEVICALFPDNMEIQDLFADVLKSYFADGPDKYIQVEYKDNVDELLEQLTRMGLFDRHPEDPHRVKLAHLT